MFAIFRTYQEALIMVGMKMKGSYYLALPLIASAISICSYQQGHTNLLS